MEPNKPIPTKGLKLPGMDPKGKGKERVGGKLGEKTGETAKKSLKRAVSDEQLEKKMMEERHTVDISSETQEESWGGWAAKPFTGIASWWHGEEVEGSTSLNTEVPQFSEEISEENSTFIHELINQLDTHHKSVGIFRVSGSKSKITEMRKELRAKAGNPNNIADALRQELRERSHIFGKVQGNLIKDLGKDHNIPINKDGNVTEKIELKKAEAEALSAASRGLPKANREILGRFLQLCVSLDASSDVNKMSKAKLAMMAGKCLMGPMSIDTSSYSDPRIMAKMGTDDNNITKGFLLMYQHYQENPEVYEA